MVLQSPEGDALTNSQSCMHHAVVVRGSWWKGAGRCGGAKRRTVLKSSGAVAFRGRRPDWWQWTHSHFFYLEFCARSGARRVILARKQASRGAATTACQGCEVCVCVPRRCARVGKRVKMASLLPLQSGTFLGAAWSVEVAKRFGQVALEEGAFY